MQSIIIFGLYLGKNLLRIDILCGRDLRGWKYCSLFKSLKTIVTCNISDKHEQTRIFEYNTLVLYSYQRFTGLSHRSIGSSPWIPFPYQHMNYKNLTAHDPTSQRLTNQRKEFYVRIIYRFVFCVLGMISVYSDSGGKEEPVSETVQRVRCRWGDGVLTELNYFA